MKKILFLSMIISLIIVSCTQDKESIAKLKELNTIIELETQNKALVQKLMDGFNNRDTTVYEEIYAPNCAFYFPSSTTKPGSRSQDLQASKVNWRALPDIRWKIEEMIAEGNMVATRYTVVGTQQEEWNGIPASGKKIDAGGIFTVRIENGKVIEQREDADFLGIMQQLGMELKMK